MLKIVKILKRSMIQNRLYYNIANGFLFWRWLTFLTRRFKTGGFIASSTCIVPPPPSITQNIAYKNTFSGDFIDENCFSFLMHIYTSIQVPLTSTYASVFPKTAQKYYIIVYWSFIIQSKILEFDHDIN